MNTSEGRVFRKPGDEQRGRPGRIFRSPGRDEEVIQFLVGLLHNAYYKNGTPILNDCEAREALKYAVQAIQGRPDFQTLGQKGGLATKATHKPDYFRRIGKLGGRRKKQNGNPAQNG
jgi:hypothetical protein